MATLRDWIDRGGHQKPKVIHSSSGFEIKQQVVVKRRVGQSKSCDLRIGTILSFADRNGREMHDGAFASVSIPMPGGQVKRELLPVSSLQPVTKAFKRSSVQFNSAFRQVGVR